MVPLFTITMFVSATLLFLVQPLYAKMLLPKLGGSPGVWKACMVFYQAALLAGYLYAHVATSRWSVRKQAVVHLVLMVLPILCLPLVIPVGWEPPADSNPVGSVLLLLTLQVGLPFFLVSTSSPMLQKWFAHTGHPSSHDPYFLYAASNLGSMAALLGYPVVVETMLGLSNQSMYWSWGYGLLALLVAGCAVGLWMSKPKSVAIPPPESAAALKETPASVELKGPATITWRRRLHWMVLAAAPSSLMLGVTTYMTTDVASAPLLWVVPLALYLLTFVIVFSRRPWIPHTLMLQIQPLLLMVLCMIIFLQTSMAMGLMAFHLLAFFVTTMVCHGELAAHRPTTEHLTEFYLWMSVGGLLGGMFNSLVAPLIFLTILEYPLMVALVGFLRPPVLEENLSEKEKLRAKVFDFLLPATLLGIFLPLQFVSGYYNLLEHKVLGSLFIACKALLMCLIIVVAFLKRDRRVRLGLCLGSLLVVSALIRPEEFEQLIIKRSFFGVHRVQFDKEDNVNLLEHGTTLHGAQFQDADKRNDPLTYYNRKGPLGDVFRAMDARLQDGHVGLVGLGSGTVACYAKAGQHWTFYEIDPEVKEIALNPRYFTYLTDCAAQVEIMLGDARLQLARAEEGQYDLLVLDAFSSDAIPMHLLTREAQQMYLSRLHPDGLLAFHISSRFLTLEPVLANLAADQGLAGVARVHLVTPEDRQKYYQSSHWVVLARRPELLEGLPLEGKLPEGIPADQAFHPLQPTAADLWTDDFTNLWSTLSIFSKRTITPAAAPKNQPEK